MSGTHLVENAQDAGAQSSTHAAEDYAASLRAAALMTLKSKRRKAPVVKVEPAPATRSIAAPPSIELDYGQEDAMGSSSIASSPAVAPAKVAAHLTQEPEPMDIDDSPGREEGEISDSEVSPPPPQMKLEPQSPLLEKRTLTTSPKPSASSTPTAVPSFSLAQPLLPHESFESLVAPALVDENHARPGLPMTQAQYETAKDIVLDLLGWGVPPEYLVGCGLSREIVYYVFMELNLRLPSNLDTTGLPPVSTSQPAASQASSSTAALRPSLSHPSLPPKPQLSVGTVSDMDDTRSLSATAAPFIPASSEPVPPNMASSSNTSLHDMEQQRRQELLARKAVLASRKLKQKVAASSISSSRPAEFSSVKDVPMVPTKVVDDFLQSIEPVTTGTASGSAIAAPYTPSSPAPSRSLYDMDMDDVPGLTTGPDLITEYTPLSRPPPARSGSMSTVTTPRSPGVPQSAVPSTSERPFHPPPSRTLSINTTPLSYGGGEDDMDAIPGLFQSQATPDDDDKPPAARRGTKRPVAADFVDMEPGPPKPYTKGPPDYFRANIRRKTTAGFAGLTQRRCVIDVSDSEDDEHDPARGGDFPMRTDSRASKVVTPQLTAAPTPRGQSPGIPPAPTPSVLQEKEEAIRKMRELIAQREQNRKKKIPVPSRSTPPSSSTPNNDVVAIKQEDDDSAGMHSSDPSRSTSSATPDPTMGGRLYDSQDERSVVDALLTHDTGQNGMVSLPDSASGSSPTTPIDVTSQTLEHSTTGDKVLTDEARHELVISEVHREQSPHDAEVDVVGSYTETSAEVELDAQIINAPQAQQPPAFASYHSLLDHHPLLRERSLQESSPQLPTEPNRHGTSSNANLHFTLNLEPLKQKSVLKYLSSGSGRICQYEVPGGGECRDQNCEDVHLSRMSSVEPSAEDTAQYLCTSVPAGPRYGVKAFRDALDVARLRHPTVPFDARVQEALTSLGLR